MHERTRIRATRTQANPTWHTPLQPPHLTAHALRVSMTTSVSPSLFCADTREHEHESLQKVAKQRESTHASPYQAVVDRPCVKIRVHHPHFLAATQHKQPQGFKSTGTAERVLSQYPSHCSRAKAVGRNPVYMCGAPKTRIPSIPKGNTRLPTPSRTQDTPRAWLC